mmetsp:Transcript_26908/g.25966  ORF Transcript_26908/g.25966 Transcript_26908/m.25966 type:complete len:139 (+) Transcript_26908:117-533(+)
MGHSTNNGNNSSSNSSAKSQKKAGAEEGITVIQKCNITKAKNATNPNNNIADNMKIIAAIQRMRMGNQANLNPMLQNSSGQNKHKKNKSFTQYGPGSNVQGRASDPNGQSHYHTNSEGFNNGTWNAMGDNLNMSGSFT